MADGSRVKLRRVPTADISTQLASLPLRSRTSAEWARHVLADPLALLADHAFLEKKAAQNAMELLARWPGEFTEREVTSWINTMTAIARDETAHLAQVTRLIQRKGGQLGRAHSNPYAKDLRQLVRNGTGGETVDRLLVSALIEARSCERFGALAAVCADQDLSRFYNALFSSELGHYKAFLKLAFKIKPIAQSQTRWEHMLDAEAEILAQQAPGPRMHSGY
jgi:tRNA-(ms[2]io[6]A)-hydroxylase